MEEDTKSQRCEHPRYIYVTIENYVPQVDPKDAPFTKAIRNGLVRDVLELKRSPLVALLCRPGLMVGEAVTELSSPT